MTDTFKLSHHLVPERLYKPATRVYTARVRTFNLPIVCLLLLTLLANASAWALSPLDAGETDSAHRDAVTATPAPDEPVSNTNSDPAGDTCNHGCHLFSHVMGQIIQGFDLALDRASPSMSPASSFILPHPPESQFRPPQFFS